MNDQVNLLEQFIFAKNRGVFVDGLIKDTESAYYFSLLQAIDDPTKQLTSAQLEDLKRYRKLRTMNSKGIRVRYLFRKYDEAKTEEEKKQIIIELNSKLFKIDGVLKTKQQTKAGSNAIEDTRNFFYELNSDINAVEIMK